jgi:hypothetical protein
MNMVVVVTIVMRECQSRKERNKKIGMSVEVFAIMVIMMECGDLRLSEKTEEGRKNNRNKAMEWVPVSVHVSHIPGQRLGFPGRTGALIRMLADNMFFLFVPPKDLCFQAQLSLRPNRKRDTRSP